MEIVESGAVGRTVLGTRGDDVLHARGLRVMMQGYAGDDTFSVVADSAEGSSATIFGGAGNDRFVYREGSGYYGISDTKGRNLLEIQGPYQVADLKVIRGGEGHLRNAAAFCPRRGSG
jgi:Ca2+-binding RTX toxin-like protein